MDGLTAKRVLIALAKKFSCESVRRCNDGRMYKLVLVNSSGHSACTLCFVEDGWPYGVKLQFNSTKWENILKSLEGKTLAAGSERLKVVSIEQLMIELELQGYLKGI